MFSLRQPQVDVVVTGTERRSTRAPAEVAHLQHVVDPFRPSKRHGWTSD
jgi:hypothetical protein